MILDKIVADKLKEVERLRASGYYEKIMNNVFDSEVRNFEGAFTKGTTGIIAEVKKASPSKGIIVEDFDVDKIINIYESLNIDAISVLTEKNYFLGNIDYIKKVKEGTTKPVLRKDFIVDEIQLFETRAVGADAVLLICAVLKEKLGRYYSICKELGIDCLVEVHNEVELYDALSVGVNIIGINNRNLHNFNVSISTTETLMKMIPKNKIVVSESGIKTDEDIQRLKELGAKGLLIGETFMRMLDSKQDMDNFVAKIKQGV